MIKHKRFSPAMFELAPFDAFSDVRAVKKSAAFSDLV